MSQLLDPNWNRAAILPYARHKQTGEGSWAVPGVLADLLSAVMLPGDVYQGNVLLNDPETGRTSDQVIRRSADLAGAMTLGAGAVPGPKNALRMGMSGIDEDDYRIAHRAPVNNGDNAPLWAMEKIYPDDIYSDKAWHFYGHGGDSVGIDKQTAAMLAKFRRNPDAEVTIYRAVPKDAPDTIARGDWVTINKAYADSHGKSQLDNYKIVSQKVRAKDLYTDGNSIHEFGFDPQE